MACIVQRRRSKRDAYICMYKEIGRKNTKYVRIVSNKKKTYKKTTLMRQVITSIPFNCIKDKSVAESIDDAMRVHELDCRSPRHTSSYTPESCLFVCLLCNCCLLLIDFGRSSYCFKKSEPPPWAETMAVVLERITDSFQT